MEAVIFTGIPGSGKTSFYRTRFFDTHVRISLDMLKTRRREELLFAACLEAAQPFVIDNTNPLASDRARYIQRSRDAGFKVVAYFFQSSLRDAMRRNAQRKLKQKIPVAALGGIFKKLQPPALVEGFDQIYTVEITADNAFEVRADGLTERVPALFIPGSRPLVACAHRQGKMGIIDDVRHDGSILLVKGSCDANLRICLQ